MRNLLWLSFITLVLCLPIFGDEGFKPVVERFSRDCPVCKWSFKEKRSADIPSKRFEGVFKKGEKCPFCNGSGRIEERIDWKDGFYLAYGVGISSDKNRALAKVKATSSARKKAAANALKLASRIHFINLEKLRIADYTERIEGVIKEAEYKTIKVTDTTPVLAVVSVKVPLWGLKSISAALFDDLQRKFAELKKLKVAQTEPKEVSDSEVTIIIDARTYKDALKRELFPTVKDENGNHIYDITRVSKKFAIKSGMVRYVVLADNEEEFEDLKERLEKESALDSPDERFCSLEDGWLISNDEGGDEEQGDERPKKKKKKKKKRIVVKADEKKFDDATVVVSKEDADKMKEADEEADAMKKGNVIVIVDSRVAGKEGRLPRLDTVLATLK